MLLKSLAAALAATLLALAILTVHASALRADLKSERQFSQDLSRQNERLTADMDAITLRAAAAEAEAQAARSQARRHERRALTILARPPSNPEDACISADNLLSDYIQDRARNVP